MDLLNRSPFAAERFAFLYEGLEMLLVVVKGTFTIHPHQGTTRVANEQEPVVVAVSTAVTLPVPAFAVRRT